MSALKACGVLVMLIAGGIGAWSGVRYERRRLRVVEGWIDTIRYIRTQIDCYLTPLGEILERCPSTVGTTDLSALLASSRLYLDADTYRFLETFTRELGGSYREEQLKNCDFCLAELYHKRETLSRELPSRQRLALTLCTCLSIGAAILLW